LIKHLRLKRGNILQRILALTPNTTALVLPVPGSQTTVMNAIDNYYMRLRMKLSWLCAISILLITTHAVADEQPWYMKPIPVEEAAKRICHQMNESDNSRCHFIQAVVFKACWEPAIQSAKNISNTLKDTSDQDALASMAWQFAIRCSSYSMLDISRYFKTTDIHETPSDAIKSADAAAEEFLQSNDYKSSMQSRYSDLNFYLTQIIESLCRNDDYFDREVDCSMRLVSVWKSCKKKVRQEKPGLEIVSKNVKEGMRRHFSKAVAVNKCFDKNMIDFRSVQNAVTNLQ
jgi:hypothetical protein